MMKVFNKVGLILVMMILISGNLFAQRLTLKGKVLDNAGEPLIGATISVIEGSNGTATNENGEFQIRAGKGNTIKISYIGFEDQSFKVGDQNNLVIRMEPKSSSLNELVVVGYGTEKRSDLTGSLSHLDGDKVEDFKSSSVLGALGGQIAGLQITQSDGEPGSDFNINIRGVGTLTGDASPLYIVDGFEVSSLDFISNKDIESIDVLKDASASAIYGARAANGVILITTKQGQVGRPRVSYSGNATYREISRRLDVLNPYEFVKLQTDIDPQYAGAYYKAGEDENGIPYKYQSLEDYIGVKGINWQDEVFKPTWSQDHSLSVSGGVDATKYLFSFNRYDEDGLFKNSSFGKTTVNMRLNQKLTDNIRIDAQINYSNIDRKGVGTTADAGGFNMLKTILAARPTGGLKVSDSTLLNSTIDPLVMEEEESISQVNPIKQSESVTNDRRNERWGANLAFNWEIVKGLTFRSAGTYNTENSRRDIFYDEDSRQAYRSGQQPYGSTQMGKSVRWVNSNQLTWNKRFDKDNRLTWMVGEEMSFRSNEYLLGEAMDFPFDNLGNNNLGVGALPSTVTTDYFEKRLLSFFSRANYNYKDKFLLTGTVRADGSTVFSEKNKWGIFPSFAAAWRISREQFMENAQAISDLKLRLGWGVVGNDRIPNYLSLDLYEIGKYGVGSTTNSVLLPKQLKNENLKWEGASTLNAGVDLGLFRDRLSLTVDAYIKDTRDLLLAQSLAYVTGFASQYQNIGKIRNEGLEISVTGNVIRTKDFSWTSNFNISFLKNKLVSLQSGVDAMYTRTGFDGNFTENDYVAEVGKAIGLMYGYEFDGIYQENDFETTPDGRLILKDGVVNNSRLANLAPGMLKYKDQNGDGEITPDDRTVIGNGIPKWYGGFTNTLNYKNWELGIFLQFNYGNDIYNATRLYSTQSRSRRSNMLAEVADRWTPENASNLVPSTMGYTPYEVYSRFIEDGSFLRFKQLSLAYTLPERWTKKALISNAKIYVTGQNLFLISAYSGFDPEVSTRGSNPMTPGVDWGAYPRSKVFTFGLDLNF